MLAEIVWNGQRFSSVLNYCINPTTGDCYHRYLENDVGPHCQAILRKHATTERNFFPSEWAEFCNTQISKSKEGDLKLKDNNRGVTLMLYRPTNEEKLRIMEEERAIKR